MNGYIPEGYHSVTASLTLKDSAKALEFYKKAFGAVERVRLHWPNSERVMHAEMVIGNSIVMMGDEIPGQACKSAETMGGSAVSFYIYVKDADAAFRQALAAGAVSVMPVADMFWGDRMGVVHDPFGYSWSLASKTRSLSQEQIKQGCEVFCAEMAAQQSERKQK